MFHWSTLSFTIVMSSGKRLQYICFKGQTVFMMFYQHPNVASGSTHGAGKESRLYAGNPLLSLPCTFFLSILDLHALYSGLPSALRGQSIKQKHSGTSLSAGHCRLDTAVGMSVCV